MANIPPPVTNMNQEPGDDYLRHLASFIRSNENSLAQAGLPRRRRSLPPTATDSVSVFNPLGWFGYDSASQYAAPSKPIVLSVDTHHLFYVLMRLEALGIDIGTLDVQIDSPSRPMSYINVYSNPDKSDSLSLASIRSSLSAVSRLSLGGGWWSRPEPPSVDAELKYVYSSFTKLPALSVNAPGRKVIAELANESSNQNALPLDAFKNLQSLECVDIDPRTLLGWDRLAESLRSLKVKKSGLEDVSDIFIGAVVDDQARREGSTSRKRRRRIPRGAGKETSYFTTRLPDTVLEDTDAEENAANQGGADISCSDKGAPSPPPSIELSPLKWAFLRHLSLSDNGLTFFPSEPLPYLTTLTYLDLSSNLLVSIPPGLGTLYNLASLNLSDNMIDSVLGIYTNLGQVLYLNLAKNRLESICGLERLAALERVDLRGNFIEESAEIGRLAILPNIAEVWVEGNPLVELEESYRVACFNYFWKERKTILLDGSSPGFYEKRNLTVAHPEQMSSSRPPSAAYSPVVVAVGHPATTTSPVTAPTDRYPTPPSSNTSPRLDTVAAAAGINGKARRKKVKRIVEFNGEISDGNNPRGSTSHTRDWSDTSSKKPRLKLKNERIQQSLQGPLPLAGHLSLDETSHVDERVTMKVEPSTPPAVERSLSSGTVVAVPSAVDSQKPLHSPPTRSRHNRYQSEFIPSSSNFADTGDFASADEVMKGSNLFTSLSMRKSQRSSTLSSRAGVRRARVSASVFEPQTVAVVEDGGDGGWDGIRDDADAYRRRIEALKKDMGDGWLKVFSQSQLRPLSP